MIANTPLDLRQRQDFGEEVAGLALVDDSPVVELSPLGESATLVVAIGIAGVATQCGVPSRELAVSVAVGRHEGVGPTGLHDTVHLAGLERVVVMLPQHPTGDKRAVAEPHRIEAQRQSILVVDLRAGELERAAGSTVTDRFASYRVLLAARAGHPFQIPAEALSHHPHGCKVIGALGGVAPRELANDAAFSGALAGAVDLAGLFPEHPVEELDWCASHTTGVFENVDNLFRMGNRVESRASLGIFAAQSRNIPFWRHGRSVVNRPGDRSAVLEGFDDVPDVRQDDVPDENERQKLEKIGQNGLLELVGMSYLTKTI